MILIMASRVITPVHQNASTRLIVGTHVTITALHNGALSNGLLEDERRCGVKMMIIKPTIG